MAAGWEKRHNGRRLDREPESAMSRFTLSRLFSRRSAAPAGTPPKVFVSATSGDLRSARKIVSDALLTIDCHPIEQSHFGPDYRTVRAMLRERVEGCQALIHIVGFRYGAEPDPASLPEGVPRRSYTQMEYDLGRELQAKRGGERFRVYTFVCPEVFPFDPEPNPEAEDKRALQRAHREAILTGEALYETPADLDALQSRIHALREEARRLQAEQNRRERLILAVGLAIVLALAGIGIGGYWYFTRIEQKVDQAFVADPVILRAKLAEQLETSFQAKLAELKAQAAPPADIDRLYRLRDAQAQKLDEAVRFIQTNAEESRSTLVKQAARTLQERGVDAALDFLEKARADRGRRLREEARELAEAALFEAELHEGKLEFKPAEKAIRAAIEFDYRWWESHNRLGKLAFQLARWDEAERAFREAERFVEQEEDRATVLNNLALVLRATNRLAEAEPLYRQALAIDEHSYGPDHPDVAIDLNNLAGLLQATNRLAEAEPLMRRALAIDEHRFGPDHPDVARDLNNLAQLLKATNRLAEAEPLMRRALAIDEHRFGPDHPKVAIRLNNLAQLLQATNRLAEAEPLMRRALAIDEHRFGPDHPDVAIDLNNLAQLLQATNRLAEAEPLMRRALAIDEHGFGPDHPDVARDLNNLARLLQDTNQMEEAEPLSRRMLVILLKFTHATGHEHPHLRTAIGNYWQLLAETGLDEPGIARRLAEAGAEAGFAPADWQRLAEHPGD
jgi:tetratricopeptide (TPR) repeat protein